MKLHIQSKESLFSNKDMLLITPTPLGLNHKFGLVAGTAHNRKVYQRLVGKFIYLSHTRLDIAYSVSVVS